MLGSARPKNLNLISIRLPLPALVSILHRATGALIFLLLPLILCALQQSLKSPEDFHNLVVTASSPMVKLPLLGLLWAFLHHFLAGLRHLTLDMRWGLEIKQARRSSKLVLAGGVVLTLLIGVILW